MESVKAEARTWKDRASCEGEEPACIVGEWEKGCKWAAFAIAATFGPMVALGIIWGWV